MNVRTEAAQTPALIGVAQPCILAVESGEATTRIACADSTIGSIVTYTTPREYSLAIACISLAADALLQGKQPDVVCIGVPGCPLDGQVFETPVTSQKGWLGLPFASDIGSATNARSNLLVNECIAGAESEGHMRPGTTGMFVNADTNFGDALWTPQLTCSDEPAHRFLRSGSGCECGKQGCANVYIGSANFSRTYGMAMEEIPDGDLLWDHILFDLWETLERTWQYHHERGFPSEYISLTGALALRPNVINNIRLQFAEEYGDSVPKVNPTFFGQESILHGLRLMAKRAL